MSDLHLEAQDFRWPLAKGDVLIVAGDLCQASTLDPARTAPYAIKQRERVLRFADAATSAFRHVLLVAGNHEHHDGIFEDTVLLLKRHLEGVTVLDNESVSIGGVRFFGTTLWSDCDRGSEAAMAKIKRGIGDYFFTRTRRRHPTGETVSRLTPADTCAAHVMALAALRRELAAKGDSPMIVISHHAPSLQSLNPAHKGNGLDGAYASDLDSLITALDGVPFWIHGHTHIRRRYRIGRTMVLANCRGFDRRDMSSRKFSPDTYFELADRAAAPAGRIDARLG
jgi:Icc-related predicted phosphoesterase